MSLILSWLRELLFPPKCVLCRRLLLKDELDLCRQCRVEVEEYPYGLSNPEPKSRRHFLDSFTAVWYYEENVRSSILRFKFHRHPEYAKTYGRLLAMRILQHGPSAPDILTWVPVSAKRKKERGYDQGELIARAVGEELGIEPRQLLCKHRNTKPQSGLKDREARKANILGAYHMLETEPVRGKRILILDDVFTTGATSEECARVLLTAGAAEVHCAAVASVRK